MGSAAPALPLPRAGAALGSRALAALVRVPLYAWLLMLVLAPLVLMAVYSLWVSDDGVIKEQVSLDNYDSVLSSATYRTLLWRTLYTAVAAAALATLIAFPMALFVHRRLRRHKLLAVMLVIIPLWVSMLLRIFAWKVILGENGFLNSALMEVGIIDQPSSAFLYTRAAVLLTLTYVAIPFVFITTYSALERIPPSLLEASHDAGADGWRTFTNVVWPLAKQGVAIGFGLALLLAVGDYLTPSLVGGLSGTMIGSVISSQFGLVGDWPLGAAMAVTLLVAVGAVLSVVVYLARSDGVLEADAGTGSPQEPLRSPGAAARLRRALGWVAFIVPYLFLYLPLFVIVLFSFSASDVQALPITGLTTRWYEALVSDDALIDALRRTLLVGAGAVAIGIVLGTWFALVFARSRGRGMALVQGALALPVLLPGMVLGIALAITFRQIGLGSGVTAVVIGHATFVTPVIMLVVLARLRRLDPSLTQASMDCGAGHLRTFWHVILPQIRSALLGGAMLGFTLSFDEIIVTFFLSGNQPTLPVYIWNQLRFGFTPQVNAVFTLIGIGSLLLILVAGRVLRSDLRRGEPPSAGVATALGDR